MKLNETFDAWYFNCRTNSRGVAAPYAVYYIMRHEGLVQNFYPTTRGGHRATRPSHTFRVGETNYAAHNNHRTAPRGAP